MHNLFIIYILIDNLFRKIIQGWMKYEEAYRVYEYLSFITLSEFEICATFPLLLTES